MENEKQENNVSPETPVTEVVGSVDDVLVQERLKAVSKAKKGGIKTRHVVQSTETVKVATAFGATTKEIQVEKVIEKTLVGKQENVTAENLTEEQHDAAVRAKLVSNGTPEDQIEAKIAEAREIRQKLSGLWSDNIKKTSSADDRYIDGLPNDGSGATILSDAGDSGVRIRFTSKK